MTVDELLSRGVAEIIQKDSLVEKLKSGKKLQVKFGVDPTAPDLHLGHVVPLKKLKQFQELGHKIVLIIGDFTATVGDPSARKESRKILEISEVRENMKSYLKQISLIIDTDEIEVRYNSEWYDKKDVLFLFELASKGTLQQMMQRDDFNKRITDGKDVSMLEGLYPLMQGYDSVCVKADVEIGGTDQKFNLLMGRKIQRAYNQTEQDIMTLPLLNGTDGVRKMSKSFGNYIGLSDKPDQIFAKVMSIPDEQIVPYYELVTDITPEALELIKKELQDGKNPRDIKARLAFLIVELIYDEEQAELARDEFDRVYKNKELPAEINEVEIVTGQTSVIDLVAAALEISKSESKRLIEQNAVEIGGEKITDQAQEVEVTKGMVVKAGRKFAKIK